MKKILAATLLIFLAVGAFASQKVSSRKAGPVPAPKAPPVCEAYTVFDVARGEVLESLNPGLKWPPASVTKLMLASVVMDKVRKKELSLNDPVTVSRAAAAMGGIDLLTVRDSKIVEVHLFSEDAATEDAFWGRN